MITLPLRLGPRDLMLTSAERKQAAAINDKVSALLQKAQASEVRSAQHIRAEAAEIEQQKLPYIQAAQLRRPVSQILVTGLDQVDPGVVQIEVISAQCLVMVADAAGLRPVPISAYDFSRHFAAGDDAAIVWQIQAKAIK